MHKRELKRTIEKIKKAKKFLLTAHMNPEGDSLGSQLAMYLLLKKLKKQVVIYNHDPVPNIYSFLPYSRIIKNELNNGSFDVAMVMDSSDSTRTGKVKDALARADCIVNIDHHISNTYFGDINWVEPWLGSTSQMVHVLCEKFKVMDKNIALCIYTGIFTDTGNFTYSNVDAETHRIVAQLMKYNLHPHKIYEGIHSLCLPSDLKFMGKIISSLKFDPQRKICWATITKWEKNEYDLTEVVFSIMRLLKEPEVFVLFKKIDSHRTRVNLRSRSRIDVNRVAKFFGGGGHKRASGTTMDSSLEATEKKIISFIKRYTNGFKPKKKS